MDEPTADASSQLPPLKQRHGCLTAYLVFMMIANSVTVLVCFDKEGIRRSFPNLPDWAIPVSIALGYVNLVCAVDLFRWKKWGFWGFTCSAAVSFVVNLSLGVNAVGAIDGLLGVAVLYGVLQIGKERKGWTQLD